MLRLLGIAIAAAVAGCGSGGDGFAVGGAVTFDGQPVENGEIGFMAAGGDAARGASAPVVDGRFSVPSHAGLLPGEYRVVIYAERATGRQLAADEAGGEMIDEVEQYLPAIYNDQTRLTATIDGDRDDLDFTLERPNRRSRR